MLGNQCLDTCRRGPGGLRPSWGTTQEVQGAEPGGEVCWPLYLLREYSARWTTDGRSWSQVRATGILWGGVLFSKEDIEAPRPGAVPAADQEPPAGPVQTSWVGLRSQRICGRRPGPRSTPEMPFLGWCREEPGAGILNGAVVRRPGRGRAGPGPRSALIDRPRLSQVPRALCAGKPGPRNVETECSWVIYKWSRDPVRHGRWAFSKDPSGWRSGW